MNKRIKKEWVAALKGGEYKQGKSYLRKNDEFCCLGVLCDLAVKEGVIDPWGNRNGIYFIMNDHEEISVLPKKVLSWAELGYEGQVRVPTKKNPTRYLTSMNDSGKTFEEIANVIQRQL